MLTIKAALARVGVACALAAAPVATATGAAAQAFPSRPIMWVVPFTPGGITDSGSRAMAKAWGERLGQAVVIDNRPGGGGGIGTGYVASSRGDGYTVIYGTSGTMAANLAVFKNVPYKPLESFKPIHGMAETPLVCVANPRKPFRTLAELVAYAKANPGKVNYSSSGPGTATHLTMELIQKVAGMKLTHVPYRGSSPALVDLVAGTVDVMCDYSVAVRQQVEAGALIALGVTAPQRMAGHPNVPTMTELGYPGATIRAWSAVLVPASTPQAVADRLESTFDAALKDPEVVRYMEEVGSLPMYDYGRDKLRTFMAEEIKTWRELVEFAGVEPN